MDYKGLAAGLISGCEENCADCEYAGDSEFECTIAQLAATAITDLLARAEAAEKIVDEYAESARAIALWLTAFCDKSLSYPSMISNAARKVSLAYADMESRAEKAEKAIAELMGISPQQRITTCFGHPLDRVMDLVKADRAGRVKILSSTTGMTCGACDHFKRIPGTCRGRCSERPYCRNKYGHTDERRGEFTPSQSRIACKMFDKRKGSEMPDISDLTEEAQKLYRDILSGDVIKGGRKNG